MGWETRNGRGAYYTRSKREGGRVVREYVGTGQLAELAAMIDAEQRAELLDQAELWQRQRERLEGLDRPVRELSEVADLLTRAYLVAAGYHQHNGQWRRRRGNKEGRG